MRIALLGSSDFSIPTLESLHASKYQLVTVIIPIDKPRGRGKKISISNLNKIATKLSYPVLKINNFNNDENIKLLKDLFIDIFVVVAFKKIPDHILNIPKYGCINIHPSKLPKYRGAAPLQWALINGDSEIGISIIKLSSKIDSGNILHQEILPIDNNINFGELFNLTSKIGAVNLIKTIGLIKKDINYLGRKQNIDKVSYAKKIFSQDCIINWKLNSKKISNKIRALSPIPGAYSYLNKKRFKILKAENIKIKDSVFKSVKMNPGDIYIENKSLFVVTGSGIVSLLIIQNEGKKKMSIGDFLMGNNLNLLRFDENKSE